MPLFDRMREMAKLQDQGMLVFDPATASEEDKIAYKRLQQINDEICAGRDGEQGGTYQRVLRYIERDCELALGDWDRDPHSGRMYHKVFSTPGQLRQARELLAMVNFANGNLQDKLRQIVDREPPVNKPQATKLSMPSEMYDACIKAEGMDELAR
jgi:hypothetical protein